MTDQNCSQLRTANCELRIALLWLFSAILVLSTWLVAPEAARATEQVVNLAPNKCVRQSSVYTGSGVALPTRAIDGNTSGQWSDGSVTHTNNDLHAWWEVDLGDLYEIDEIDIYNRTDCCSARLSDFYVLASDTPFPDDLDAARAEADWEQYHAGTAATEETFEVGEPGRYVRVQLSGQNVLSLAEVEVLGNPQIVAESVPSLKIAAGSTTPGQTAWEQYGSRGLTLLVDTSEAGFTETPQYFTSISGDSNHWLLSGVTSIYSAQPDSFRVYVLYQGGALSSVTPEVANQKHWHLNWYATSADR